MSAKKLWKYVEIMLKMPSPPHILSKIFLLLQSARAITCNCFVANHVYTTVFKPLSAYARTKRTQLLSTDRPCNYRSYCDTLVLQYNWPRTVSMTSLLLLCYRSTCTKNTDIISLDPVLPFLLCILKTY